MPRYRRKPVVVEAVKLTKAIKIESEGQTIRGLPGDYLITESDGQQYPVNAELFEEEYEQVRDIFSLKAFFSSSIRAIKRKSSEAIHAK